MEDETQIGVEVEDDYSFQAETVIVPGATGPIPERARPTDPPIVVGIPVVKWRGRVYSRNQIARDTGIGLSHISKIFKGTRRPSLANAIKLAQYFGVTTEILVSQILPRKIVKLK